MNSEFFRKDPAASAGNGSTLVVPGSANLEDAPGRISAHGSKMIKESFSSPGGWRFHFKEPRGNELAVWSDHDREAGRHFSWRRGLSSLKPVDWAGRMRWGRV